MPDLAQDLGEVVKGNKLFIGAIAIGAVVALFVLIRGGGGGAPAEEANPYPDSAAPGQRGKNPDDGGDGDGGNNELARQLQRDAAELERMREAQARMWEALYAQLEQELEQAREKDPGGLGKYQVEEAMLIRPQGGGQPPCPGGGQCRPKP